MKNAHERFGFAEFQKTLRDTTTRVRLTADRFIGEDGGSVYGDSSAQAHLLSVVGTDVEVAAIWAAILGDEPLMIGGPEMQARTFRFGERPGVYRGTLTVPGRKRPVRHLIAASATLRGDGDPARVILRDDSPEFVLERVAGIHGLPVLPHWADWFLGRLREANRISQLSGLNCDPVAVTGVKAEFLSWIGAALKSKLIQIPEP
jgi:hypothetical protein